MISYMDKSKAITADDLIRRYGLNDLKKDRKAINTLNDGLTKINKNLENYIDAVLKDMESLQSQVDGNITTWFFVGIPTPENSPAKDWIKAEDRTNHLGDLYYDQNTGYAYRWANIENEYKWLKITDNDVVEALAIANSAKDTADSKRRVFYDEPVTPYDSGDIWIYEGEIYRCIRSRGTGNWNTEDWINDLKYTDDTIANKAIEDLNKFITEVTTHYVTNKIMEETINSISSTIQSVQLDVDKKNQVFLDQPIPPYNKGDIWIEDEKIYVCITPKENGNFSEGDFRLDLDSTQFATKTQIEQTDEKINLIVESQQTIESEMAQVANKSDVKSLNDNAKILSDSIAVLQTNVSKLIQGADNLQIDITNTTALLNQINNNYVTNEDLKNQVVTEVTTTTGFTLNKDGLKVAKTGAKTSTIINEKGLGVNDSNNNSILYAGYDDSLGDTVLKTNKLIINNASRFENYNDQNSKSAVGCFWTGG